MYILSLSRPLNDSYRQSHTQTGNLTPIQRLRLSNTAEVAPEGVGHYFFACWNWYSLSSVRSFSVTVFCCHHFFFFFIFIIGLFFIFFLVSRVRCCLCFLCLDEWDLSMQSCLFSVLRVLLPRCAPFRVKPRSLWKFVLLLCSSLMFLISYNHAPFLSHILQLIHSPYSLSFTSLVLLILSS